MKTFIKTKVVKYPNLAKFCENKPEVVKSYVKHFETQDEAEKNLRNKIKLAYKEEKPGHKKCIGTACDISSLFAEAKAEESFSACGWRVLEESVRANAATSVHSTEHDDGGVDNDVDNDDGADNDGRFNDYGADDDDSNDNDSNDDGDNDDGSEDDIIVDKFNLSLAFKQFTEYLQAKGKQVGFYVDCNLQELLALSNVLLLKTNEHEASLIEFIGSQNLNNYQHVLIEKYTDTSNNVEPLTFNSIMAILKTLNKFKFTRREIKEKINDVAKLANDDDYQLIDILINCINKLPDHERLHEEVCETELICTFLDSIITPLFHDVNNGKLFRWLNTMVYDTDSKRPDGHMSQLEERIIKLPTGFVEVKPSKSRTNSQITHEDSIRLSNFCKDALEKNNMKALIAIQAVGYYVTFYMFTQESSDVYVMCELLSINAPKSISELPEFFTHFDQLKQVMLCYKERSCLKEDSTSYNSTKKHKLCPSEMKSVINVKKPKGTHASISFK
ncbi:hypothetical protein HPULCUR_008350 [Helicostylum pulchrum]|uniref:Uncharacterized protein n=1 Tax=Helicostylum pulchrum TaxID=562976 RepID=A0ABP9Y7B3_9FUNG